MMISEEIKVVFKILISIPLIIIIFNRIKLMHLEDVAEKKQLSFKQRDWILNRKRRCKKK